MHSIILSIALLGAPAETCEGGVCRPQPVRRAIAAVDAHQPVRRVLRCVDRRRPVHRLLHRRPLRRLLKR